MMCSDVLFHSRIFSDIAAALPIEELSDPTRLRDQMHCK